MFKPESNKISSMLLYGYVAAFTLYLGIHVFLLEDALRIPFKSKDFALYYDIYYQDYSKILIAVLIATLLCLLLFVVSFFLSLSNKKEYEKTSEYECGFDPFDSATRQPFDVHFYIVGILFLIFDVEVALLFP